MTRGARSEDEGSCRGMLAQAMVVALVLIALQAPESIGQQRPAIPLALPWPTPGRLAHVQTDAGLLVC